MKKKKSQPACYHVVDEEEKREEERDREMEGRGEAEKNRTGLRDLMCC